MGNNNSCEKSKNAICLLNSDLINGYVYFHQCNENKSVKVIIYLEAPTLSNQTHAIHIHNYGDLRKGCETLGSHFNPFDKTHGSRKYDMPRHAGDMINNVTFNRNGIFKYTYYDNMISLYQNEKNILGRSIVIHKGKDDLGRGEPREESLKTGNAGERICCGIIGLSEKFIL